MFFEVLIKAVISQNSRRFFLINIAGTITALCSESLFAAQEFWNKKKNQEWSSQEIRQLTTRSPWAKDVHVELRTAGRGGYAGGLGAEDRTRPGDVSQSGIDNRLGLPGADSPPPGIAAPSDSQLPGQIGDVRRGSGGMVPTEALGALVRWESAQPVIDALHTQLPADLADHYVIGVSGLPALEGREFRAGDEGTVGRLMASATLQAKGKSSYQAGVVHRSGKGLWFGFAKESMPLTAADRDVTFELKTEQLDLRATFQPKEMLYLGKLAV